jgi:hypothetical protein
MKLVLVWLLGVPVSIMMLFNVFGVDPERLVQPDPARPTLERVSFRGNADGVRLEHLSQSAVAATAPTSSLSGPLQQRAP